MYKTLITLGFIFVAAPISLPKPTKQVKQMSKKEIFESKFEKAYEVKTYEEGLLRVLKLKATAKRHVNVLQHMMGYFSDDLSGDERKELLAIIEDFRHGYVPLVVPLTQTLTWLLM